MLLIRLLIKHEPAHNASRVEARIVRLVFGLSLLVVLVRLSCWFGLLGCREFEVELDRGAFFLLLGESSGTETEERPQLGQVYSQR